MGKDRGECEGEAEETHMMITSVNSHRESRFYKRVDHIPVGSGVATAVDEVVALVEDE